jgi:membrane protein
MLKKFIKEVSTIWTTERPNQLAAALAYYSMFSFAPIIFVAVSIVGLFIDEIDPASQFFQRLEEMFGAEISALVQESVMALANTPSSSSVLVSLISFLALLFAASGLFFQLQYTLNTIWRVPPPQKGQTTSFVRKRVFSFLIVIGFGLLGVLAVFLNLFLTWLGSTVQNLIGIDSSQILAVKVAAPLLIAFVIALFYKILPETKVAWRDVWLGSAIATVLIVVALMLVGLFFQYSSASSALQASGAFAVLLTGFYYGAQIFLLGAVCCRVYADLHGSRRASLNS